MFNEKEVYKVSIGAACNLSWPTDFLVIQVLDDSTEPAIKQMVEMECQRWESKACDRKQKTVELTGYCRPTASPPTIAIQELHATIRVLQICPDVVQKLD
ncbi:hypothetical protein Ahy_B10g103061 isoform C [Arachis hypogaea]|uniref:Uncharacterized protein n=1 Tax=Arachis hypogaea TaxID=3818 RepID=A0A444X391_ARAHY|nr:hypothetical protein Ahy_B10g103061 isoform C [Arachis hypogaea]